MLWSATHAGCPKRHCPAVLLLAIAGFLAAGAACAGPAGLQPMLPANAGISGQPAAPASAPEYLAAPTPNADLSAPRDGGAARPGLQPSMYPQRDLNSGDGYTPGSIAPNLQQNTRRIPIPGINLKLPLN